MSANALSIVDHIELILEDHFDRTSTFLEASPMKCFFDLRPYFSIPASSPFASIYGLYVAVVPRSRNVKQVAQVTCHAFEALLYGVLNQFE